MARFTVSQLMQQIASTVNQEATSPTVASSEWNLWLEFMNRAYEEWVNSNDWEETKKWYFPAVVGASNATISLPTDYRKLAGEPILYDGSITTGVAYPEVRSEQKGMYAEDDKYIYITGNPSAGYSMVFNPATLASGVSLAIMYYSNPTSLSTTTNYPLTPDPVFLVDRTIAYVFEARSDPRFQIEEQKARDRLTQMIENADAAKYSSYAGPSYVISTERKQGFRFGRD